MLNNFKKYLDLDLDLDLVVMNKTFITVFNTSNSLRKIQ